MTAAVAAPASDSELVADVVAGHAAPFEVLVRRHNQRLYRAARAITRSDVDAEDVLQQAWLAIFRALPQFRSEAAFTTWATRIVIHEAISVTRKRPVVVEVVDESDAAASPEHDLDRSELGALLEACLARIPQGNREVMVLRHVLELDTAETAACLGLTEEAVRVRLYRARAAIAAELDGVLGDAYGFAGGRCDRITARVMAAVRDVCNAREAGAL